jgi:DNA-directed RNA polymerases I and III subunit RPAC2
MNQFNKLEIVCDTSNSTHDEENSRTFQINDEDHTLANALRYMIMKNPQVIFCGYTIPHPSETKVNLRIKTNKQITGLDALVKGLLDLNQMCAHVLNTFDKTMDDHESQKDQIN